MIEVIEVIAVAVNERGCEAAGQDLGTIASRRQSLSVAAKLAQVHDVEMLILDTCGDDVLHLLQMYLCSLAFEHTLWHPDIVAPDADLAEKALPCFCWIRRS